MAAIGVRLGWGQSLQAIGVRLGWGQSLDFPGFGGHQVN
jgi:hypothetical protein